MNENVSALVLAAGSGRRIGNNPKAFLNGAGSTLLERSVNNLVSISGEVIVGLSPDKMTKGTNVLDQCNAILIEGGNSRLETIEKLVRKASRDIVVIHDVARPFISTDLFDSVIQAAIKYGAASAYIPASVRDGVALRSGNYFSAPLAIDEVIMTQTPQAFQREIIIDAFDQLAASDWNEKGPTALVSRSGYKIRLVESMTDNVKITFPEDLVHLDSLC